MIAVSCNGASFYRFNNLSQFPGIDHGIFTRKTGHSQPPFASLNISNGLGDDENTVARNRSIIAGIMGADEMICLNQVHGCDIAVLGSHPQADHHPANPGPITADAAVTDLPGNYLLIQVADCQSVLMYEPVRQVVANVHSGWRSSIGNIIGRTVEAMEQDFKCRPDRILAGIGPSLGPCCSEFIHYKTEIPAELWHYKDSVNHFDFWSLSVDQLTNAGVPAENVESSQMCTRCRTDEFFSYRAEKTTGRFAAVIGLKGMTNGE